MKDFTVNYNDTVRGTKLAYFKLCIRFYRDFIIYL